MKQQTSTRRFRQRNGQYSNAGAKSHSPDFNSDPRPDIKVRGTHQQIRDRYSMLAKEAVSSGDRVLAENYHQHAEHYLRLINAQKTGEDGGDLSSSASFNQSRGRGASSRSNLNEIDRRLQNGQVPIQMS